MNTHWALSHGFWTWILLVPLATGPALAQSKAGTHTTAASSAQPASSASTLSPEAQAEYDASSLLFKNGDYPGALVKLQRAYELSHDPRMLWNMIVCEKNLRHYARMHILLHKYLDEGGTKIADRDRQQAQHLIETVRSFVSAVKIEVDQPNATVSIDGEVVGISPLQGPVLVDLGSRQLRVTKAKYRDWTRTVQAPGAGEITVTVALEKLPELARLSVFGPKGSAIQLDGKSVGTQTWEGPVTAGRHHVHVTGPNAQPYDSELVLHEGETRRLVVSLPPAKSSQVWWWVAGGLALTGTIVGGYFLLRPTERIDGPAGSLGTAEVSLSLGAR